MLGPNKVDLEEVIHYLVTHQNSEKPRKLLVVKGRCNDCLFEATGINDPDLSTKLDLFRLDGLQFSRYESASITNIVKMSPATKTIDCRSKRNPPSYSDFHAPMVQKHCGEKVYFRVIYDRKDEAKGLGASWDPEKKKWYVFAKSPELRKMDNCFHRATEI